jgi:TolA-binding protein
MNSTDHSPRIAAALALLLLWGSPGWAAPKGPSRTPWVPGTPVQFTPEEIKEVKELLDDVKRFKAAATSYRQTVNSIVRRAYEDRRRKMLSTYEKKIRANEAEERVRRIAAITLFEDFLRRYPNDKRWTPDVIFRLAELYFEKANDEYLMATDRYDKEMQAFERGEVTVAPTPPKQDYSQTIELHRRLIREFPRYRLVDGAYYLLGFCLTEMGELERGNQGYLALVCSNRFRPPLSDKAPPPAVPAPTAAAVRAPRVPGGPAVPARPELELSMYNDCRPLIKTSRFNPESWIRIGEFHFDENQLGNAIAAYRKVLDLGPDKNPYYDAALYKLAWTYYRADKFTEAIKHFDALVGYADKEMERTGKKATEMRPESVQYLGISFAEEDWDGDTLPDPETGIQRIESFYANRHQEKHVFEVYRRLADIYYDTTKYDEGIKVYKLMLQRWPYRPENPEIQDRVIVSLERQRKFDEAISEREVFTKLFGKGTEWERRNRSNPKALRKAQDIDEQALIQAAVFHHKAAKTQRDRAMAMSDGALLEEAKKEYSLAAKAYEKYLERFPNTKNSYEIRYSLASCLFYSERFLEAGKAFALVRDSNMDNRYQEEAAFSAAKAYEVYIENEVKAGRMVNPDVPKPDKPPPNLAPMAFPDPYKKWQAALDAYRKTLPTSPKTPRLTYKAAELSFRFLNFDDARKRFGAIFQEYCKDPMAITAGQAILVTYKLEKNMDKMEEWATKLSSGKCGGGAAVAKKTAEEAGKLIMGIRFKRAMTLFEAKDWDKAAAAFLSLVDADPKGSDADKALFNAGVCYEKSQRFDSATRIYERLWKSYPDSSNAHEALWRSSLNYKRFFEFDRAVQNYLILADSPRFKDSEHRVDSIYNAAVILENDQAYDRSAKLFLRYAKQVGKPKEAAEAYFRAGLIYEKMKNYPAMVKIFRDFPRLYGSVEGQARYAVEGTFRIAQGGKKRGDWATAAKYYRLTMAEFSSRGLAAASDAAEYAANSAFELAERKLQDFLKVKITGALAGLMAKKKKMEKQAITLKQEYERIWNYKRARWTLAAMYRRGTIYEHFARSMDEGFRNAPIPRQLKRMGQEAIDIYQTQLDEKLAQEVDPITEEAKRLYKECVERARQMNIANEYTEEALKKLNAFDPLNWPLLKRAKVEMAIE